MGPLSCRRANKHNSEGTVWPVGPEAPVRDCLASLRPLLRCTTCYLAGVSHTSAVRLFRSKCLDTLRRITSQIARVSFRDTSSSITPAEAPPAQTWDGLAVGCSLQLCGLCGR